MSLMLSAKAGSWFKKSCSCSMGTMGTSRWNLKGLGINDKTAGRNFAFFHRMQSSLDCGTGRLLARAVVL